MKILQKTAIILSLSILPFCQPTYAASNVPPEIEQMRAFLSLMQDFYGIVNSMEEVSGDPAKAVIIEMFKIQEIYEKQGNKIKSADVFRRILKQSKNATVRNAASIMLGDLLKDTGQSAEAIKVLNSALSENLERLDN